MRRPRQWFARCASLVTIVFARETTGAQPGYGYAELPPFDDVHPFVSFACQLLIPKTIGDVDLLKEYVRGEEFRQFRVRYGDRRSVDAIFHRAMRLSLNNIYEATWISMFATMSHRRVGVNLPIMGPLLWFPLTSEFEDDFLHRVGSLPRRLYHDSPDDVDGDRDKLQHFFGSAFIACWSESEASAEAAGAFIEENERLYIVEGEMDDRDLRTNQEGRRFGIALMSNPFLAPSMFLAAGSDSVSIAGGADHLQEE